MMTPFSLARLMASMFLECDECPSRRRRILFSCVGLTSSMKCFNHSTNTSESIHPDLVQANAVPAGAPSFKESAILNLLNISIGGMYRPVADTQYTPVVFVPLSVLVTAPTCFFPFRETTLEHF